MTRMQGFGGLVALAGAAQVVLVMSGTAKPPLAKAYTEWFVATTGNDVNGCTSAGLPCLTIGGALSKISNGTGPHVITVAAGIYTEDAANNRLRVQKSGASHLNRITVRGYAQGCPTTANTDPKLLALGMTTRPAPNVIIPQVLVQASNVTFDCVSIRPGAVKDAFDISGTDLDNITLTSSVIDGWSVGPNGSADCRNGVIGDDGTSASSMASNVTITNSYITGCGIGISIQAIVGLIDQVEIDTPKAAVGAGDMDGTRAFGDGITISRTYFHGADHVNCGSGPTSCHVDCFQSFSFGGKTAFQFLTNFTYTRNTCENFDEGVLIHAYDGAAGAIDGITITNNTFAHQQIGQASAPPWCMNYRSVLNIAVSHNTCVTAGNVLLAYAKDTTAPTTGTFRNNIIYGASSSTPMQGESFDASDVTVSTNIFYNPTVTHSSTGLGGNTLNTDPLLANVGADDFHLTASSSVAINQGGNLSVTLDHDGRARDATPDIGAFQFVGGL